MVIHYHFTTFGDMTEINPHLIVYLACKQKQKGAAHERVEKTGA